MTGWGVWMAPFGMIVWILILALLVAGVVWLFHVMTGRLDDLRSSALDAPMLLKTVQSHRIDPTQLIMRRLKLDKILDAYETFGTPAKTNALKILIEA